jgi:hypothetical protein
VLTTDLLGRRLGFDLDRLVLGFIVIGAYLPPVSFVQLRHALAEQRIGGKFLPERSESY